MPIQDGKVADREMGEKVWCNGEFEVWRYPGGDDGGMVFRVRSLDTQFGWRFRSAAGAIRAISAIRSMQEEPQGAARMRKRFAPAAGHPARGRIDVEAPPQLRDESVVQSYRQRWYFAKCQHLPGKFTLAR